VLPDDAASRLIAAIHQAAELIEDSDEKSRLRRLADTALDYGRSVLADVLATVITKAAPGLSRVRAIRLRAQARRGRLGRHSAASRQRSGEPVEDRNLLGNDAREAFVAATGPGR
jgi:hypothetical protein